MAATETRYYKPNMAALPPELGRRIIKTILETPKADDAEVRRKADEIADRIEKARQAKNE